MAKRKRKVEKCRTYFLPYNATLVVHGGKLVTPRVVEAMAAIMRTAYAEIVRKK